MLGSLEEQDAQIAEINAAEEQYKQDGNLDALVAFWNGLWANGGLVFNGSHWHFRAVDLNIKVGNNDKAWSILGQIYVRQPEYREKVHKYRYKIMKGEKRYMGALEHLVNWYAADVAFGREKFLAEVKKIIKKVEDKATESDEEIADRLADIAEQGGDIHEALKKYYVSIGWLDERWLNN